jgi:hypothetical protein
VTTHLAGAKTRFLPFNKGKFGGAGNPPVSLTQSGYATAYLWEETWARDSVLELVRQFIQEVEEEDDRGRKTGKRFLIFPRYQQLDAVCKMDRSYRRDANAVAKRLSEELSKLRGGHFAGSEGEFGMSNAPAPADRIDAQVVGRIAKDR